jgi:hypothetical protein
MAEDDAEAAAAIPEPEPEQSPAALAGLSSGTLTSTLAHHMVIEALTGKEPLAPTVLRGTATALASVELIGYQYSGAQSPMPGSPYMVTADDDGRWEIMLEPADGSPLPVAGPCTLVLRDCASGSQLTAYGCWFGDAAECMPFVTGCSDYGAPADHLYCPPSLRAPSATKVRTAEEYKELGADIIVANPQVAHRTHVGDADPLVATFDNFLTAEEATAIIETANPVMRRAGVTTDDGKGGRKSTGRTNDLAWLPHDENPIVATVVQRVADLIGLPAENAEKLQVIHYQQVNQRPPAGLPAYPSASEGGGGGATGARGVVRAHAAAEPNPRMQCASASASACACAWTC